MAYRGLVTLKLAPEAKATLVWLPHAGGSAAFYQALSDSLPNDIECFAAEYPGRGRRRGEPPSSNLESLVRDVAASFDAIPSSKPIIVFGHSMGARIGFELCRHLQNTKRRNFPTLLIVSACEPLHLPRALPLFHGLPDDELTDLLMFMSDETSTTGLERELLLVNLNVIRSDLSIGETHRFTPYPPPCLDLAVYGGTKDPVVRLSTLTHWRLLSTGSTTFKEFDGGHFYMLQRAEEFLDQLVQDVLKAVQNVTIATRSASLPPVCQ